MWLDELGPNQTWVGLWGKLIQCGECGALMDLASPCPVCTHDYNTPTNEIELGEERFPVHPVFAGAITWTSYVMFLLMQREWERPLAARDPFQDVPGAAKPSQRLLIVLLFWSHFEHLMDCFFVAATRNLANGVTKDLLSRYSSIGSRLDKLYRILFDTTFEKDLESVGCPHAASFIMRVHKRRNDFIHGNPGAIDDALVQETVERLQELQTAWVKVYNLRCANLGK